MLTKTVRSRFSHEIGEIVEGCTIVEKHVVIPPDPVEKRRGVYDYVVEVPPAPAKATAVRKAAVTPERSSFSRSTPEERGGVIRRVPAR
jgi:hypothetical protein